MSPREASVACKMLKVETVIPMHFGTFPALTGRPEQLDVEAKVWALTPGVPVEW
jgi:L-ascorbate metabolism protein UlaG (beta-lactamase superfamily)